MSKFKYISPIFFMIYGLIILFYGFRYFEESTNWLELFKALFWIILGSVAFGISNNDFRNLRK